MLHSQAWGSLRSELSRQAQACSFTWHSWAHARSLQKQTKRKIKIITFWTTQWKLFQTHLCTLVKIDPSHLYGSMQRAGGCTRARSRSENLKRWGDPGAFQGSSLLPHYRVTSFQEPERQTAFSIPSWRTDQSIHAGAQVNDASLCCRREASHFKRRKALWHRHRRKNQIQRMVCTSYRNKGETSFLWLFFFWMESWGWRRLHLIFKSTESVDVGPDLPEGLKWMKMTARFHW